MKIKLNNFLFILTLNLSMPLLSAITPANTMLFSLNSNSGAINEMHVANDTTNMNWIIATDGSQYDFINENYGWGLGYFTTSDGVNRNWQKPDHVKGDCFQYRVGNIRILISRKLVDGTIQETYTLKNVGKSSEKLTNIGIYTPFNDNYPNAKECVNRRCNAHIWAGGDDAYICAMRMGGYAPNVGLVLTEGKINSYEIWERGVDKHNSQTRGIIALCPEDMELKPGQTKTLKWSIFPFSDRGDFIRKAKELGSAMPSASHYVLSKGETAVLNYCGNTHFIKAEQPGEMRIDIPYGKGKKTYADLLVFENFDTLLNRRANFIVNHQRMTNHRDERYGAFMIYDNEGDSIYPNNTRNCNPVDRDEGAERTGMGVFLAKHHIANGKQDKELEINLKEYALFLRNKLQTDDYKTYSSIDHKARNRAYNYAWTADFYFLMYEITKDKKYAVDGYRTLRSMYDQFGHGFYAIGIPVIRGTNALKDAGLDAEYDILKGDFRQVAETYISNGLNYPAHEVNYEQSIVAPCIRFLCEMYLLTDDNKYLDEIEHQMPVLESFNGFQPNYHLNDIAIRHWDGYWFGKREMFGDTFPHYWSCITAAVFHLYAKATGKTEYQERAENIVRNNLCLFSEDGRGYCAYLYPKRVNGEKAEFYDPYANDQDWALAYWYQVMKNI